MRDFLFGDPSILSATLSVLVMVSFATGAMAAYIEGRLTRDRMIFNLIQKTFIFLMLIVARMIDLLLIALSIETFSLVSLGVIAFYAAHEIRTILINNKRVGLIVPNAFETAIDAFMKKSKERGD